MQNKSKSRTDVQWIISSISLAATLGLWGFFASADKKGASVSGQVTLVQPPTDQQQVIVAQPAQAPMLLPGQVLLFQGTAPQAQQLQSVVTTANGSTTVTRRSGGGGGGSTGGTTTKPPAHTGSSKPAP